MARRVKSRRKVRGFGVFLALVVVVLLVSSLVFSVSSFSGYVVSEEANSGFNLLSAGLFLLGIIGAWFLLKRKIILDRNVFNSPF